MLDEWGVLVVTILFGCLSRLGPWTGLYGVIRARRKRRLYRYGVMATATRAAMLRGGYVYPDVSGTY
ncbi:hypothetical protein [Streptomyces sp. NPDC012825]|uniref:hypothetical protein n=1 Tax=Streptomyces sp. NPDC012825 TaxID=3364851 RepID=UPI00367D6106